MSIPSDQTTYQKEAIGNNAHNRPNKYGVYGPCNAPENHTEPHLII